MGRMWEIRENDRQSRRSGRNGMYDIQSDVDECDDDSYECGYDDGYRAAMRKMRSSRSRRTDE